MIRYGRAIWVLSAAMSLGACDLLIGAKDRERGDNVVCGETACDCAPGRADCDGDPDNGCETDVTQSMVAECDGDPKTLCETKLLTDGEHCGSCDRSCLGGECQGGFCVPQKVPNGDGVYELVFVGDSMYYTSFFDTGIFQAPRGGGAPKKIAETPTPGKMLRLYKDVLYFSTDTQIMSVPLAGGTPKVLAGMTMPTMRMAAGGDKVYWVEVTDPNPATYAYRLQRTTIDGAGMPETVKAFDGNLQLQVDVVATDTDAYYTDGLNIMRTPHTMVSPQPFALAQSPPLYLELDGDQIYTDCGGQGVFVTAIGGKGMLTKVADAQGDGAVTTDAENVYYLSSDDYITFEVRRIPKAGGTSELLAATKEIVFFELLYVDDKWVYWTTQGQGLRRVPK